MHWVLLAAIGVVILLLLVRWGAKTEKKVLRRGGRYFLAFLSAVAAIVLATRGVFALAGPLAILAAALAIHIRLPKFEGGVKSSGQKSRVETLYLRVLLDQDSGDMDGEVLIGAFQGRRLDELDREELRALLGECRAADADAERLLTAYLARRFPEEPGPRKEKTTRRATGRATRGETEKEEAYKLLGLKAGASVEQIKDAHRRLIKKFHPDQGGSDDFAARLNRAKEILLN